MELKNIYLKKFAFPRVILITKEIHTNGFWAHKLLVRFYLIFACYYISLNEQNEILWSQKAKSNNRPKPTAVLKPNQSRRILE